MRAFAADPERHCCFWLPHIGLFTGARVNEICQLNPQTDILRDPESGIDHLWITELSEGDERVKKSTKNPTSRRKVPIHSTLLALGFLDYVERVRGTGAMLLFPTWKPSKGRASPVAEKWFRQFIVDVGLRDDSPFGRIVGMHAFRHTLLHRANNLSTAEDVTAITGHAGSTDAVVRGYQGELSLVNKRRVLEAITFEIDFITPMR
jgi:integrase